MGSVVVVVVVLVVVGTVVELLEVVAGTVVVVVEPVVRVPTRPKAAPASTTVTVAGIEAADSRSRLRRYRGCRQPPRSQARIH